MDIKSCFLTENDCFLRGSVMNPSGIVVHSTGASNPNLRRYVQPDDGILGVNRYGNHWNRPRLAKCVNAFIGLDKNGEVRIYQTLPWEFRPWGVGSGKKGSYNRTHIQFEICEDSLSDKEYFTKAFGCAIELCAYLCRRYGIPVSSVVSHYEAYKAGYGSNHGDPDHWLKIYGLDMDDFRSALSLALSGIPADIYSSKPAKPSTPGFKAYGARVTPINGLNIRSSPSTSGKKLGALSYRRIVTVVAEDNGWGYIKSPVAGWISLRYVKKTI